MAFSQRAAVDEIMTCLREAWNAGAGAASGAGQAPELLYEETSRDNLPPAMVTTNRPWGRVRITHHSARQRTVSAKRFNQVGSVLVECYVPETSGDAKGKAQDLADVVLAAFEGQRTPHVTFREVTPMEAGRAGLFYQIDVAAVFEYQRTR